MTHHAPPANPLPSPPAIRKTDSSTALPGNASQNLCLLVELMYAQRPYVEQQRLGPAGTIVSRGEGG